MRRPLLICLLLVVLAALMAACATEETSRPDDELIGAPPPPEEDPFAVAYTPEEAVPVEATGTIGPDEPAPDQPAPDEPAPDQPAPDQPAATQPAAAKPSPPSDEPTAPSTKHRCFSCVRICPLEGDCAEAKQDVICGWGTGDAADDAERLARAECDAALDMARQMPVWSRIEGSCPPPTCRGPGT